LGVIALVTMSAIMRGVQGRYEDQLVSASEHVYLDEERLDGRPSLLAAAGDEPMAAHVAHQPPRQRQARLAQPRALLPAVAGLPGINAACGLLLGQLNASVGARRFDLAVRGIEPVAQNRCTPLQRFVRRGSWNDFVASTDAILLGAKIADERLLQVGDRI